MSETTLEQRLEALENEVANLKEMLDLQDRSKDWRKTVGMFADDPGILEIQRLGREYRQKDRETSASGES